MSVVYLGYDLARLADKLANNLDEQARTGDFFVPASIVVPNRHLRKWLRFHLARKHGIAINLDFQYLEDALWSLLRELDPAANATPPEAIDENTYRLMVLAVLLEAKDPHLAPLRRYLQIQDATLTRLTCRRAWYLADRLGLVIRDYEYARQDALIQHWLKGEFGLNGATEFQTMMERSQRALFAHITREPDGKRAMLNRQKEITFKTFPQYAMERMTGAEPMGTSPRTIHFFGFTHVCELHARTIAWLGRFLDIRWYHPNALVSRLDGSPTTESIAQLARSLSAEADAELIDPGRELLRLWGRAGSESLEILQSWPFAFEALAGEPSAAKGRGATVLSRLREQVLGAAPSKSGLDQDVSLQIVGCPGIAREVETVYDSIVHNLQSDASLRQTDVAVLVTDMAKYRAALQAVFERPPRRLQYNLVDFSAAGASTFGQAVLGMLDLALESFSRSRVFGVLLNPCFLARLGVDRAQAMTWLEWAESLGIYQGWDADEKAEQGYARSPLYCWRLGLQRLRLGRFMDMTDDDDDEPARRFGHVLPFADLASGEREQLDAFCRAVEGLLPMLARLRKAPLSGDRWAHTLARLVQEFLEAPADRPEEAQVRDELLAAFAKLERWDALFDARRKSPALPLALVREYVQSQLEVLEGNRGDVLVGGVTIAALKPMRPIPFAVVYVVGLGEDLFPGSNALSSFDLRGAQRSPGDIRPAEQHLYDFLAAVLAAQQKLYLTYNNHDLQKDQPLLPAAPLQQLQRYVSEHVLQVEFQITEMPAHADDARFVDPARQPPHQDVLVQTREADRCLALGAAIDDHRLALDRRQETEWASRRSAFQADFSIAAATKEPPPSGTAVVTLSELKRFLRLPAQAALQRHLRVEDDKEQAADDDEPLVTSSRAANQLLRQTLHQVVLAAARGDLQQAIAKWKDRFESAYDDSRLRCRVPEEAFGEIDRASLVAELQERIHGQGQIEAFLHERAGMTFCGPILVGESSTPIGARLRFPALTLRPGRELGDDSTQEIRVVGSTPFAWHAPGRLDLLVVTNVKEINGREIHVSMLDPALFHLALLAGSEPNAEGVASSRWVLRREVSVHVAHRSGIQTWTHPAGSITPAEALAYFVALTRDFLDPAQFDLLPFDVLFDSRKLPLAVHADFAGTFAPEHFQRMLEEAVAEARDNPFGAVRLPALVAMIGARVPADALAKAQRRFRLLDRGPARVRQQPKIRKVRKTAKT